MHHVEPNKILTRTPVSTIRFPISGIGARRTGCSMKPSFLRSLSYTFYFHLLSSNQLSAPLHHILKRIFDHEQKEPLLYPQSSSLPRGVKRVHWKRKMGSSPKPLLRHTRYRFTHYIGVYHVKIICTTCVLFLLLKSDWYQKGPAPKIMRLIIAGKNTSLKVNLLY